MVPTDPHELYRMIAEEQSKEFQDFLVDLLWEQLGIALCCYSSRKWQYKTGESRNGIEVKFDGRLFETGNLYIEYAEKATLRPGDFAKAGVNRHDNAWLYVIGNYQEVYVFSKKLLADLKGSGTYQHVAAHTGTSQGYLLPRPDAEKHAIVVLKP